MKVLVFYGSVRSNRQGIRAARYIIRKIEDLGHKTYFADPLELNFPLLDKMYKEYKEGEAPDNLTALASEIKNADAFVVVSGEYNHSIPPALSNLMDHFLEEYKFRPSGTLCYSAGRFGGVRVAMHLRAFLTELGTVNIPTILPVANIQKDLTEEGKTENEQLEKSANKFLKELIWYAQTMKDGREKYDLPY